MRIFAPSGHTADTTPLGWLTRAIGTVVRRSGPVPELAQSRCMPLEAARRLLQVTCISWVARPERAPTELHLDLSCPEAARNAVQIEWSRAGGRSERSRGRCARPVRGRRVPGCAIGLVETRLNHDAGRSGEVARARRGPATTLRGGGCAPGCSMQPPEPRP